MRTSPTAVHNTIATTLGPAQVAAYINDAALFVTEEIASKNQLSSGRLEIVERYLACALIRLQDLGLANAQVADVREQYQVDPQITEYLLRAASFDTTGAIRRLFLAPPGTRVASGMVGQGFRDEEPRRLP